MDFNAQVIANLILSAILVGVLGIWLYFLFYMIKSFRFSPHLDPSADHQRISKSHEKSLSTKKERLDLRMINYPLVSVILPARNEEKYISACLDSLLAQDYPNFEIVAINDCSSDRTGEIIIRYSQQDKRVKYVQAPPKPAQWAGKNWACTKGYEACNGDLLLFTDADTIHSTSSIALAVNQLTNESLDALSAVPKLICNDNWTRVTLPILSVFLHTRFSALRVNDPKTKTGYFFGSFYIMRRSAYEKVGTHEAVKQELVEDGALGARVKESGLSLKMVRGEGQIRAVWARDLDSLWHGLRRLMIPLFYQSPTNAVLMTIAIFFMLFEPFLLFPYSLFAGTLSPDLSDMVVLGLNLASVLSILLTTAVQCKYGIYENPLYAAGAPIGGAIVSISFISAIADAKKRDTVVWRDRRYTVTESQHPLP